MNVIGTWRVAQTLGRDEDYNPKWMELEDFLNAGLLDSDDPSDALLILMMNGDYVFTEDGKLSVLVDIPKTTTKEEIDEAVASGEMEIVDGKWVMEKYDWKEKDGGIFYDSGVEGTVFDEEVDPWTELKMEGDLMNFMTLRLKKAE